MSDPRSWAFPLGRLFGITIKVHWLFPIVALALVLRAAYGKDVPPVEGLWIDATLLVTFLFGSVLLHEFGHCFAARSVHGDASEVLLWPLGGLATVEVPHTPRDNFVVAAAGPLVNLSLCLICILGLALLHTPSLQPPWNPLYPPYRIDPKTFYLWTWSGSPFEEALAPYAWPTLLARLFWVNWALFWLNVLLIGFPMDGGRMFQCVFWAYSDHRRATIVTGMVGCLITTSIVGVYSLVANENFLLALAILICYASFFQWKLAEEGVDESIFGYDFSQGYTSLERAAPEPAPPTRRLSWWQRWLQRRAARRIQREIEDREADERRMDELLEKISARGKESLTEEEKRFMIRFSERYRNRNNS